MRMLNIYIFVVFNCLHLLSGFFCSFNWNVYFTLILVNISPKPYRSTVCDCVFVCFPVALRSQRMHGDSLNAIIGKGHRRRRKSQEAEVKLWKTEIFSGLANKRCRLKILPSENSN